MMRIRFTSFNAWLGFLAVVLAIGGYYTYIRFTEGFWITALSDYYPWGLWKAVNVFAGVALSAGAFTMAFTVYVLRLEKFRPVLRPAVLGGLIGYSMALLALLYEIAQPERWWHPLYPPFWQPRSVLFEVYWCIFLYTMVLVVEFSPSAAEKYGWSRLLTILKKTAVPVVMAGVILSTLHQSSLGALYAISPEMIHPLWYSTHLDILFFMSAVAAAPSMVILQSVVVSKFLRRGFEKSILASLAKANAVILVAYLALRAATLTELKIPPEMFFTAPRAVYFWGEILALMLGTALLLIPSVRQSIHKLFAASLLVVTGVAANRINTVVTAWLGGKDVFYFPTFGEFMITFTIIALGLLAYTLAVKYLPVFPQLPKAEAPPTAHAAARKAP